MEPKVTVEALFNKTSILEAITDCNKKIGVLKGQTVELMTAISDLEQRKLHYRRLIDAGKYDKASMERSISGIDVEIRRYRDRIDTQLGKKQFILNVIQALNNRLAEVENGKSV